GSYLDVPFLLWCGSVRSLLKVVVAVQNRLGVFADTEVDVAGGLVRAAAAQVHQDRFGLDRRNRSAIGDEAELDPPAPALGKLGRDEWLLIAFARLRGVCVCEFCIRIRN